MPMRVIMASMAMKQVHEGANENEEIRCEQDDMLPVEDQRNDHRCRKGDVEPCGNMQTGFHGWGWE